MKDFWRLRLSMQRLLLSASILPTRCGFHYLSEAVVSIRMANPVRS